MSTETISKKAETRDAFCRGVGDCLRGMAGEMDGVETRGDWALRLMVERMAAKLGQQRGRENGEPLTGPASGPAKRGRVQDPRQRHLVGKIDAFLSGYAWRAAEGVDDGETLDPEILARVVEEGMTGRYGAGAYYTPGYLARFICREMLAAVLEGVEAGAVAERLLSLRVMDPACGGGAFLMAMLEEFTRAYIEHAGAGPHVAAFRQRVVGECLHGLDVHPLAVYVARVRLELASGGVAKHVAVGDSLLGDARAARFGMIAANPPYVNVFEMEMNQKEYRKQLRQRYVTAREGFDLFVPFVERCVEWLKDGGVLGVITPNKLLSAEYAGTLRKYFLEHMSLLGLVDLSRAQIFGAGVYPVVTLARKETLRRQEVVIYGDVGAGGGGLIETRRKASLELVGADGAGEWSPLVHADSERYRRVLKGTRTLGDLAEVTASASVGEAYHWRAALQEQAEDRRQDAGRYVPLVVSGSVRAYEHLWGRAAVRYLKCTYKRPLLDTRHAAVSEHRRNQIFSNKVVVSGLARRPTAVWCAEPLACGVATVLVIPRDGVRGDYLAALLNSDTMAKLYEILFGTLALAGGYLRFGVPQLRRLPVPEATPEQQARIALCRGEPLELALAELWGL